MFLPSTSSFTFPFFAFFSLCKNSFVSLSAHMQHTLYCTHKAAHTKFYLHTVCFTAHGRSSFFALLAFFASVLIKASICCRINSHVQRKKGSLSCVTIIPFF